MTHTRSLLHSLANRYVAADARAAFDSFQAKGGKPFHEFTPEQLRENYVSSTVVSGMPTVPTVTHRDYNLRAFTIRVYLPEEFSPDKPTAGIVYLHGGGWVMGNLATHHTLCQHLAANTGLPVAAVDYRLAPEHKFPAAFDDSYAALTWFTDSNQDHGLNIKSVSVVGDSAGGQLAASIVNQAVSNGVSSITSQVLLYPVCSVTEAHMESSRAYQRVIDGFPLVAESMRWFTNEYIDATTARTDPRLSPLEADLPTGLPPTFIVTVDNDPLAEDGAQYALKLVREGVDVRFEHLAGYAHGLFTSAGTIATGAAYVQKVSDFIAAHSETEQEC